MSNNNTNINQTIADLLTTLKPHKLKLSMNSTPVKRSSSSMNNTNSPTEETPAKRLKVESILDVSYEESAQEVRRMRLNLLSTRNRIMILENQIEHMHTVRKEMQIMFDNETAILRAQVQQDSKNIEDLESQLQNTRKKEIELKKELADVKLELSAFKTEATAKIDALKKDMMNISSEKNIREIEDVEEIRKFKKELVEIEALYKMGQEELEVQKKVVVALESKVASLSQLQQNFEMKEVKLQKALQDLKDLEYIKETYEEIQRQAKTQQHKLSTFGTLEAENKRLIEETKRLKDEVHNKLILEEEVHDLRNRLVTFKEHERKLASLQVDKAQCEVHLTEWRMLASSICETSAPDTSLQHMLRSLVERLQHQEINLMSEKMELEQQYKTVSHDSKVAHSELEKNRKLVSDLQTNNQQRQNLIHRMQKKLQLISKERDSYRKQLDSYEKDLTICMTPASSAQPGAGQFQSQKERIDNLEQIVDGYKELIAKLESDLQKAEPTAYTEPTVSMKTEQMNRLKLEVEQLKSENVMLRDRKDQLEIQLEHLLVGQDVVKETEKIIHPIKNPLSAHIEKVSKEKEKLQEEVEKLKRKIRNLEEGLEQSKLNESVINTKEVNSLREQVKTSEIQVQRLKDYFKSSMQEFRNVIYMMMGYKVDKSSNSNYKLTSMYAERPEDQVCFQLNTEGGLDLLENQFSTSLVELIDLHLRQQNSIPVFLSALTMELFNNRTVTKTYAINDDEEDDDD
nr:mitotic spindle assembly checkpoint protein MAD1 [Onthophagus taurus]